MPLDVRTARNELSVINVRSQIRPLPGHELGDYRAVLVGIRENVVAALAALEDEDRVAPEGVYVKVASESDDESHIHVGRGPNKTYSVYTGDAINPPHCPCEHYRQQQRSPAARATCKHIELVVHGRGMR